MRGAARVLTFGKGSRTIEQHLRGEKRHQVWVGGLNTRGVVSSAPTVPRSIETWARGRCYRGKDREARPGRQRAGSRTAPFTIIPVTPLRRAEPQRCSPSIRRLRHHWHR